MPSKLRILFMCRQRGLRLSTATVSITVMWRQYGHGVGCDHSVSRPITALPPFFVRTRPDLPARRREALRLGRRGLSAQRPALSPTRIFALSTGLVGEPQERHAGPAPLMATRTQAPQDVLGRVERGAHVGL